MDAELTDDKRDGNNLKESSPERRLLSDSHPLFQNFLSSKDRHQVLERAIQSARNGIVITDPRLPDNPIVYSNQAFSDMTGYGLDEILGKNCRFLQGNEHEQPEVDEMRQAIVQGISFTTVLRNFKKDGTLFFNELSIAPVHDDKGELINFVGVQNDVTSRKEAERQVSEFHSMVSHELRTPLTSIKASLGLVEEGSAGEMPQAAMRMVQIAIHNAERLLKLVDEILDLKKIESGKLQLNVAMIDPDELLSEMLSTFQQIASRNGVQIEKEVATKRAFCADPNRVAQVLLNLVGNAGKFSLPTGVVVVKIEQVGKCARIAATDHGPGIEAANQDKLFVKFQQLDSSDTRAKPGSGLGLAISKKIVELHGGEIGCISQPGKGSTFWFTLPVVPKNDL